MLVCHYLHKPMGWAALGGFESALVDNGGPYRSRLETIATLLGAGAVVCILGATVSGTLVTAIVVTALVCFAATYARVASERIASTSVIILVLYFAGFGRESHSFDDATLAAAQFVLGGLWAALLTLLLWPVDPFRPAREAVAACYLVLAKFTRERFSEEGFQPASDPAPKVSPAPGTPDTAVLLADAPVMVARKEQTSDFQREMRLKMEKARQAVGTAPARSAARTVRARNLTILLETSDMLFAITMRWRELAEDDIYMEPEEAFRARTAVREATQWLSGAEQAIAEGLLNRPTDRAASFLPWGAKSLEHIQPRLNRLQLPYAEGSPLAHLERDQQEALEDVQIAFESVRSMWTGLEQRIGQHTPQATARWEMLAGGARAAREDDAGDAGGNDASVEAQRETGGTPQRPKWSPFTGRWVDALRANWTFESVMMRHALRMGAVGAVDILLMRLTHVRHGSWLAMTSIIVLQPSGSGTIRKGLQRTGGTIAGGLLAAVLATAIHSQAGLITVITVSAMLTLATYAVDYFWYSFFLTPTFVLMSMPYFRDWGYAAVRMLNTALGALVAILAMHLLWPERERLELGRLLGRGAKASAGYLRAMVRFWGFYPVGTLTLEQYLMAPARRLSGLAINDAEESLDRMMRDPTFGRKSAQADIQAEALTFVTYLRRLIRVATALTTVGEGRETTIRRVRALTARLEAIGTALEGKGRVDAAPAGLEAEAGSSVEEQQMRRLERQVGVLERSAAELLGKAEG
jgi:uncharacterized membrane protein YccC